TCALPILAQLIKQTEKHALRRSMGEITAADIMSRDLYWSTPDAFIQQAWQTLQQHRLRAMPVLEKESHKLIGIVTLVDLLKHFRPSPAGVNFGQLKFLRGTKLRAIMSSPVVSVREDAHMADLVFMLSDRGLHCLPVVDQQERLGGMIAQAHPIAAPYQNWRKHLPDGWSAPGRGPWSDPVIPARPVVVVPRRVAQQFQGLGQRRGFAGARVDQVH